MSARKLVSFRQQQKKRKTGTVAMQRFKINWRYVRIGLLVIFITALNTVAAFAYTEIASACPKGETCQTSDFLGITKLQDTFRSDLKQNNGITSILVVGVDTRGPNSGLMNTDTIMVVSIDRVNDSINMVSIPRDLWVTYQVSNDSGFYESKVNGVYANAEAAGLDGMESLKDVTEKIIGLPIHYDVLVTLEGFEKAIDSIGGIEVDVPEGFTGLYPEGDGYIQVPFQSGEQHMNGLTALQYARIRQTLDNASEGSDFARAKRQQKVIDATKEKILSSETYTNPQKLWELYSILKESIIPNELMIADITAALDLQSFARDAKVTSVVLDPAFGGLNNYIFVGNIESRGYTIQAWDSTYTNIQNLLAAIRQYPGVYNEQPSIAVYDATTNYVLQNNYGEIISSRNPLILVMANNIPITHEGDGSDMIIYDFTNGEKNESLKYLQDTFNVKTVVTDPEIAPRRSYNEDFALVIYTETSVIQNEVQNPSEIHNQFQ